MRKQPVITDAAIRAAEVVVLADPSLPYWRYPIYCGDSGHAKLITRLVVKLHANQPGEVSAWRERIKRVCAEHPAFC
jgi:hypothetical protein